MMHTTTKLKLIETISRQINPNYPHWVLFKEGSYVIFTDESPTNIKELEIWAKEEMQKALERLSTVYTYKEDIIPFTQPKGWIVPAIVRGIYTFVSIEEFDTEDPSDIAIWVKGRNKQIKDSQELEILHINCPDSNDCCKAQGC